MNEDTQRRLERLLVISGIVPEETLRELPAEQPRSLPDLLLAEGHCTRKQLLPLLAEVYRCPAVDVRHESIDGAVAGTVSLELCRRACAIPLRLEEKRLLVAFGDPEDFPHVDEIRVAAAHPIDLAVGLRCDILSILGEEGAGESVGALLSEILREERRADADAPPLRVTSESEATSPAVRTVDKLLKEAVDHHAAEVHVPPPIDPRVAPRLTAAEGTVVEASPYDAHLHRRVMNRLRVLADLVGKDRRKPQHGRFRQFIGNTMHCFDVRILPGERGERATLLLDPTEEDEDDPETPRRCHSCNESLKPRWNFCPICGNKIPPTM